VAAASVYKSVHRHLLNRRYERVYVYNGRQAIMRAVLRASQDVGVDCFCHEKGGTLDRYSIFKNALPHDREYFRESMTKAWEEAGKEERTQIAKEFFEERRNAVDQTWFSYIKDQEPGRLPENWDASKRNIVIFNSSEDEFTAIGAQWDSQIYSSQFQGIEKLVSDSVGVSGVHFYLRVHPTKVCHKQCYSRQESRCSHHHWVFSSKN